MKLLWAMLCCVMMGCSMNGAGPGALRLYAYPDMEDVLQDYYTNELKRVSPGLACGNFKKNNIVGCFKLLADAKSGKAVKLVYEEPGAKAVDVYLFNPADSVFIEKITQEKLVSSGVLTEHEEVRLDPGQPSLNLVFFGKSAVVFYWKEGAFHPIWTAD